MLWYPGGGYSSEYAEIIDRIRNFAQKNFIPLEQKSFYFFHGRNQIGEERVANYFQSKGYAIVRPETLPLEMQLNILANCENFASSLGSISHNALFLKDNVNSIYIPRLPAYEHNLNPYQVVIDDMRNLNVTYIDTTLSIFPVAFWGAFCYIISKQLKEYFGDEWNGEYTEDDFVAFLIYAKHCQCACLYEPERIAEYYAPILPEFISQLKKREDLLQKFGVTIN